ncbi:cellulose biosynthesis cyclic di-GMP-binding regulatory protein BcsB (plasmid) [Cereibacter azotoformans]|uniref:cellulose biosynthesis cyclic di-GMP-binding regulatory protein BcsB n=1 Tax=Cereibacter azotoformans TaxID=43057 RepID=UPI001EECCD82|nr:cellulose biosynthesis cyclic di-GMP-binding regulatory protein BcsB [Cereibacter azotoformans]ULB12204.1 cellulose biosynthesis cyclic di-GMP-binding regulatory protein BcsB [Cereibacter azotoformans]
MRLATAGCLAFSLMLADGAGAQVIRFEGGDASPASPAGRPLAEEAGAVDVALRQRQEATGAAGDRAEPSAPRPAALAPLIPQGPARIGTSILRQQGTQGRLEFEVFAADPGGAASLILAYRNSIAVLPEASSVTLSVNGRDVARFAPRGFDGFVRETIPIPPGLLIQGLNRIVLEPQLTHRIYCSTEAWFQLWSDWNLSLSGLAMSHGADQPVLPEEFRAALRAMEGRAQPLVIRRDSTTLIDEKATLARLIGHLGAATGGSLPPVEPQHTHGLHRKPPSPARVTFLASDRSHVGFRRGGDGAAVLVIEYPPGQLADLDGLALLLPPEPAVGDPLPMLTPGRVQTLSSLGFEPFGSSATHSSRTIRFRLPQDWLILTNEPATLTLVHAAMPGLVPGSQMVVRVNGEAIRLIRLDGAVPARDDPLEIRFESRRLRPGINSLDVQVVLPSRFPDRPCPPDTMERFRISPTSTLHVPASPRMILPDLGRDLARVERMEFHISGDGLGLQAALGALLAGKAPPGPGPAGNIELHVVDLEHLPLFLQERPGLSGMSVGAVLRPLRGQAGDAGEPEDGREDRRRLPLGAREALRWLQLAFGPGQGPLEDWLRSRQGTALLASAGGTDPRRIWLVLGPDADPRQIAGALRAALTTLDGPRGEVALLGRDGRWQSWGSGHAWPRLLEPVSLANLRAVVAAYVSWAPGLLVVAGLSVSWIVAIGAWLAIRTGRKRRQG